MEPDTGNATPPPEAPDSGISTPESGAEAGAGAAGASGATDDGNNGKGLIWDGDPTKLDPAARAAYDEFNRGAQAKYRELADRRKALDAELAEVRTAREEATRLSLEWQSRLAATKTPQGAGRSGDGGNAEFSVAEARERFNKAAAGGDGFDAMVDLIRELSGAGAKQVVSASEQAYQEKIQALEASVASLQSDAQPQVEMRRMDAAFQRMTGAGGSHRELNNAQVREHFDGILRAGDPTVSYLLGLRTDEGAQAALEFAAEKAIRRTNEGRITATAERRGDAASPDASSARGSDGLKPRGEYEDGFSRFLDVIKARDPGLAARNRRGR